MRKRKGNKGLGSFKEKEGIDTRKGKKKRAIASNPMRGKGGVLFRVHTENGRGK